MNRTAPIFAVLMSLVMVLTTYQMTMLRSHNTAVGEMVLCTGTGPMIVYMDQNGQPTGAPHICPDCALAMLDCVAQFAPLQTRPDGRGVFNWPEIARSETSLPRVSYRARAPPVSV
ncbi:hypothetical protein [Aestuariibius sp. HNIBRBA575]|uniref:hypothetical protein n=1 Tax=Aestuariibius sp. HNIBRBA575 TaxID=3233343 RepID=UPI0034A4B0FF